VFQYFLEATGEKGVNEFKLTWRASQLKYFKLLLHYLFFMLSFAGSLPDKIIGQI
jgi:hypothetical protein